MTKTLNIRVSPELYARIQADAQTQGRSVSNLVSYILAQYAKPQNTK